MRTLVFAACALLASSSASAQVLSFSTERSSAAPAPRAVAAADFNRDGWLDYASAGTGRDSVGIHLNRGAAGGFLFAHDIVVGGGPFDMAAGDLNRDAIPDLAIANADLHTVTILLGTGDGSFRPKTDLPVPGNPRGIALADHDRDGRLDIFVTRYAHGSWTVFYGDGEGGTRAETTLAAGTNPQGIVVADFDNDGVLDVVVANVGSALTAYYSHGPMAWTGSTVPGSRPGNVLEAADFNQDGWTDLAVAYTSASRLSLYLGGPSGLRWSADRATGSSPRGVLAADLNQDGLVDLVTANRGSNTLSIFAGRRDAPDGFAAAVSRPAGRGSRRVAAGDFNHDGRLDLVSVNESVSDATLLLNTTTLRAAAFSFHLEQPLGPNEVGFGTPDGIEIADLDRNGRPDVVLLGGGGITIHFDGTARRTVLPIESLEMFGLGHFNRDGQLDIATLSYWNDQVQVFLGDGSGRFSSLPPQPLAKGLGLRVADLNRDGTSDLVVRRGGVLTVLYSRGDGVLEYGGDVQPPENAADVVVSDVNRDGIPDFVAGHGFPGGVSVLYGDASGSWLRTDSFATDDRGCCGQVGVGDFNEDGVPDIVLAEGNGILLFAGRAAGGFAPPVEQPAGTYSFRVTLGDVNLDGQLDIVQPASDILFGNGDGTFVLRQFQYPEEGGTQAIADLNLDGLPDIVSATHGWFAVMANERNETNHDPVAHAGTDFAWSYADQFGDGDPELDAWGSTDPDLHELTYEWRNEAGDVVSTSQSFRPSFPAPGTYTFTVTAYDGYGGSASDSVTWTITPFKEIVMYAAESFWTHGAWQRVEDETAAGDARMLHPDAGAAKVTTPLANPVNYIEYSFPADPTQTYKLWIRGKAQNDRWSNDSVWVQFDGAVASDGQTYAIGTTSALPWNLEECSGCGISGWGWEDDAWGAVNRSGVTLRFPRGGHQTIRIQTREDGVSIDQVVLSAERYLTARPGTAKDDTVVLERTFY